MPALPPLPPLEEARAAWRARFRPCYRRHCLFGVATLCLAAPVAWYFFGHLMLTESAVGLALLLLGLMPMLAIPPAMAEAGPYPTAAQYAKVAEFRRIYEAHRRTQDAQRSRMAGD